MQYQLLMGRLHGFDVLRGICALAVAIYHLFLWENIQNLNTIGDYSVYIFFVLSGASIYVAYVDKLSHGMPFSIFLGRRFFRLAPLYWLLVLIKGRLLSRVPKLLLNLTFLFGLANPGITSMLTGGWSIGIEFVFYLLFPVFLMSLRGRYMPYAVMAMLLWMQIFYAGSAIDNRGERNWETYTQFISFIAYFYGGCLIGKALYTRIKAPHMPWAWFIALLISLSYLGSLATPGDLTGFHGALFAIASILVVYVSAYLYIPDKCIWIATALGNMSYGLYLLHPYIYTKAVKFGIVQTDNRLIFVGIVITVSIILALLLEKYYERKIRRFGYQWLDKKEKR
jgi:peptidoglycan/LPS O-acetylase OafA/YrhL